MLKANVRNIYLIMVYKFIDTTIFLTGNFYKLYIQISKLSKLTAQPLTNNVFNRMRQPKSVDRLSNFPAHPSLKSNRLIIYLVTYPHSYKNT